MSDKDEVITSYKGFDNNLKCRDFQYEIGGTFKHDGDVEACKGGFHACEYPLDVFSYYPPAGNRFAIVEQSGKIGRHGDDTKIASSTLKIGVEIGIVGLVKAAIEYTTSRCKPIDPESSSSSTGYQGAASSTGYQGAASSTGYQGAASSTGDYGAASSTGDYGAASSTGYQGAASSTGYHGAASSTGSHGAASSTGSHGAASSTGDYGAASSTGSHGAASSTGEHSCAMAAGISGKAKGSDGCALFLVYRDEKGDGADYARIVHAKALIVGRDGIKADTWYSLNAEGEPVEV
jgi:hypothetical protein